LEESLIEEAQRGVLTKILGVQKPEGVEDRGREDWIQSQAAKSI